MKKKALHIFLILFILTGLLSRSMASTLFFMDNNETIERIKLDEESEEKDGEKEKEELEEEEIEKKITDFNSSVIFADAKAECLTVLLKEQILDGHININVPPPRLN